MMASLCAYHDQPGSPLEVNFEQVSGIPKRLPGGGPLLAIFSPALLFWRARILLRAAMRPFDCSPLANMRIRAA